MRFTTDWLQGKPTAVPRSPLWPKTEKEHLIIQPFCQVCHGRLFLNVHHKLPFHLFPDHELDPANLITLCEYRICHFLFGHGLNWKLYNPNVERDVALARAMILGAKSA